jgi:hypothetical protein
MLRSGNNQNALGEPICARAISSVIPLLFGFIWAGALLCAPTRNGVNYFMSRQASLPAQNPRKREGENLDIRRYEKTFA